MRNAFRAILAALATAFTTVWEKSRETGLWVARQVASIGAIPAQPIEPPSDIERALDAALSKPPQLVAQPSDDKIDRIQKVARIMNRQGQPTPEDLKAMAPLTVRWLWALEPGMRLVVGNVDGAALETHLNGKKALRGILAHDAESVAAWHLASLMDGAARDCDNPEQAVAGYGR